MLLYSESEKVRARGKGGGNYSALTWLLSPAGPISIVVDSTLDDVVNTVAVVVAVVKVAVSLVSVTICTVVALGVVVVSVLVGLELCCSSDDCFKGVAEEEESVLLVSVPP